MIGSVGVGRSVGRARPSHLICSLRDPLSTASEAARHKKSYLVPSGKYLEPKALSHNTVNAVTH